MARGRFFAASAAGAACAIVASAVPSSPVPAFTWCEEEDNDVCTSALVFDANDVVFLTGSEAARDQFWITGKLHEDCIWERETKCAIRAYDKAEPARNSSGQIVQNSTCEPLVASSLSGDLLGLMPNSDGTIRLGVTVPMDALDGTVNGLGQNHPHGEIGQLKIKVFCPGDDDGPARGGAGDDEPDFVYCWEFQNGADALRVAFECDVAGPVDVICCRDEGTIPICYDVDFYQIENLIPGESYCIEIIGGLTPECEKTDTTLGIFDKQWFLIPGIDSPNDDGRQPPYSKVTAFADGEGALRFAVSGRQDLNFNGLIDTAEDEFFFNLVRLNVIYDESFEFHPGASVKEDATRDLVIRYPREIWEMEEWTPGEPPEFLAAHGVCGGYCVQIALVNHVSESDRRRPDPMQSRLMLHRVDVNGDGVVNASDLAFVLSLWTP